MRIRTLAHALAAVVLAHTLFHTSPARADGALSEGPLSAFLSANPNARAYQANGLTTTLAGPDLAIGASPLDSAAAFIAAHLHLLEAAPRDLLAGSLAGDGLHVRPIMPGPDGAPRHFIVSYIQQRAGLPVFRADLRLLVRNEPGFPIVLAASQLKPLGNFVVDPVLRDAPDLAAAAADIHMRFPALRNARILDPIPVIWAGADDRPETARLAVLLVAVVGAAGDADYARRLFVADAATGRTLHTEDLIHKADITGRVDGMATPTHRAAECDDETLHPVPYARVAIGSTVVYTGADGTYSISAPEDVPSTLSASLRGRWFRVYSPSTDAPAVTLSNILPPGPADFILNQPNTSEQRRSELNAYLVINRTRDMALLHAPTFPVIGTQMEFIIKVHMNPATGFYDGTINLGRAGSGYNSFAFHDIAQHEYGHHLVAVAGSGQGAYGEGFGDLVGLLDSDQPVNGLGYQVGQCNMGARNAVNTINYPCNGEAHHCGQLLTGCVWEARNELLSSNPDDYLQLLRDLSFNSVLMHTGSAITPANVTEVWLALDDDDANVANGTPHFHQIQTGFGRHAMAANVPRAIFQFPSGHPAEIPADQPTALDLNILPGATLPDPVTARLFTRIGTTGPFTETPLTQLGGNTFRASLPGADCGDTLSYYFSVLDQHGAATRSPATAPTAFHSTRIVSGQTLLAFSDNAETDTGWTVTALPVTVTGLWTRAIPTADGGTNSPPVDGDGSGSCWLTGALPGEDIDGGRTTLTSPVINAEGAFARVAYWRWFSNAAAGQTGTDQLIVEYAGDGGSLWRNLESVAANSQDAHGGWVRKDLYIPSFGLTPAFRIRIHAQDYSADSPLEAAIDGLTITFVDCISGPCPADFNNSGQVNEFDIFAFLNAFFLNNPSADFSGDDQVSIPDLFAFLSQWTAGCD